jgi:hypothetical protein
VYPRIVGVHGGACLLDLPLFQEARPRRFKARIIPHSRAAHLPAVRRDLDINAYLMRSLGAGLLRGLLSRALRYMRTPG